MTPIIAGSINPPAARLPDVGQGWRAGRTPTGPHRRCAMFMILRSGSTELAEVLLRGDSLNKCTLE